jgi:AraC-like DNA-binding protein
VGTSEGIIIVRTRHGRWSAPPDSAVWVPSREHAELETCAQTSLRTLYIRESRAAWCAGDVPGESRSIAVGPLLRELASRVAQLGQLDRRVAWHTSLATLLLHEVRSSAREPHGLLWPADPRAARVASLVQARPDDARTFAELCRGQGASVRTVQRLFPLETGLTFDRWRARVRFLHASRLLAEGCKVADAAGACGYQSVSAFVAAFRREAGVTPGVFCANAASSPV